MFLFMFYVSEQCLKQHTNGRRALWDLKISAEVCEEAGAST